MKIDEIMYSVKNLMHRRLRSFLSVLSILIGITAIFALVSFGLGMQDYINEFAEEAGTNTMYIQAKGAGAPGLDKTFSFTEADINFVGKIKGVKEIMGMYVETPQVEFRDEVKYTLVIGFDPDQFDFVAEKFTVDVNKGRRFREGENGKVVLGYLYQFDDKIFSRGVKLGDKIKLNEKEYDVVGFFEEVGNPADDSQVYLTNDAIEIQFPENKDKFSFAIIEADDNVDVGLLAEKISDKFRKRKGQDEGEEDFFVMTFQDTLAIYGNVIAVINGVLVLIAMISLVVAAVNIMNTMYTAVLERTKEIGVMKAVGARNDDILFVFVFESGLLGVVGGIIGVLLGYTISKMGGYAILAAGYAFLKPVFPWYLTAGCLFFAFFVGSIAGLLPAYQASKQKPVDALRYE